MDKDRPTSTPATTETVRRDTSRIFAEIAGGKDLTDPFAAAVRATRMPMIITDPRQHDNPIIFVNDAFCRLTGYDRTDIVGHNCRFLQGPKTDPDDVTRIRNAVAARERIEIAIYNYRKDGTPFWNQLLLAPVKDAKGEVAYFFASQYDVTSDFAQVARLQGENAVLAAKQADSTERLHASQERLKTIVNTIDTGFAIVEVRFDTDDRPLDYRFLEANPAFERQAGVNLRGKWVTEFAPDLERFWFETYGHVALTGEPANFENYAAAFGRWFDVRAIRVGDPADRQIAIFFNDVTGRKHAEQELLKLNETLEQQVHERTQERDRLWRNTQDIQVVIDGRGVFQAVNPAFTVILGWTAEDVLGRTVFEFIVPADEGLTNQALQHARVHSLPTVENRYRHKEGGFRWISWVAAPEGELIYASGRHITAEKDQAEALRLAEEALRQSQKMEAVGQLTGGLAHDFNNLLAGISGSLELMQTRMQQGRLTDVDRYMTAAQGAAKRAAALTHRLLAFSRRQTLDPRPTDVNRLVSGMQELIQRTVGPAIAVEVVGTTGAWPALVDPPQLENALLNLCINARDAMPDGGSIIIETANKWMDERAARQHDMPEGQYLSICVTDTGTGMPPEIVARVFEPFFTTKPIGEGTGLGLSMIYGFAQQSGGQVRVYSEVGQGTTVCIYLPRHYGEVAEDEGMNPVTDLPRSEQGETVLIVDDEPTVRMLVSDILEDLGYTAIEAGDSAAGLKVLQSDVRIDLLVTDVGLPGGMNGRQMADAARVARPDLNVLFITGYAENAILGNGHLAPGMAVLTKPFAIETMAARIRSMIEGGKGNKRS
ncbi:MULTISPECIES: PAS domain S-box protein [Methylobacterium]|jgi:PAS domain S-box-containing protein|uniref:histidine kinase n=2 Tax=Methylobacterium TaxID=407 RepID=A0ABV2NCE0_9HYPH|nr:MULTISPECIES: PAS domain S-box protein [Methylobacterium]MBP2492609.1 PAS domain S-box-containing protein [Methylobacterium sp. PvP105]MBP2501019.1 PAS domain S-box-containing protein [Methylobacterium sp. PvP109]MCX7333539.1 PAS domain S-box protein [Hyphomicrobiales bacterium]